MDALAIKTFLHLPPKPDPFLERYRLLHPPITQIKNSRKLVSFRGVTPPPPPCCLSCPCTPTRGGILKKGNAGNMGRAPASGGGILKRRTEVWAEEDRKRTISFRDEGHRSRVPRYQLGVKRPPAIHPFGLRTMPYQAPSPYSYDQRAQDQTNSGYLEYQPPARQSISNDFLINEAGSIIIEDQIPPVHTGDQYLPNNIGQHPMPLNYQNYDYPYPNLTSEEMNFGEYLYT